MEKQPPPTRYDLFFRILWSNCGPVGAQRTRRLSHPLRYSLTRAAAVSEKCSRVAPFINSWVTLAEKKVRWGWKTTHAFRYFVNDKDPGSLLNNQDSMESFRPVFFSWLMCALRWLRSGVRNQRTVWKAPIGSFLGRNRRSPRFDDFLENTRWFKPWPLYPLVEGHQQPFQKGHVNSPSQKGHNRRIARKVNEQCSFHPGWLGYIRDEILPRYIGIIISHYKDPYQPTSMLVFYLIFVFSLFMLADKIQGSPAIFFVRVKVSLLWGMSRSNHHEIHQFCGEILLKLFPPKNDPRSFYRSTGLAIGFCWPQRNLGVKLGLLPKTKKKIHLAMLRFFFLCCCFFFSGEDGWVFHTPETLKAQNGSWDCGVEVDQMKYQKSMEDFLFGRFVDWYCWWLKSG